MIPSTSRPRRTGNLIRRYAERVGIGRPRLGEGSGAPRRPETAQWTRSWAALVAALLLGISCTDRASDVSGHPRQEPESAPPPTSPPDPQAFEGSQPRPVVWVAVEGAGLLAKVDVRARKVLRRIVVSGRPHNITVAGRTVVASLPDSGLVAIVHRGRLREVAVGGSPHDAKPAGRRIVVTNEGAARLELLSRSGRWRGSIPLRANPHDVAVAPNGRVAWVSLDGDDALAVVDLGRREVREYVPTGEQPHDLLFAPDGRLWVTDWSGVLHVLTRRGRIVRTLRVGEETHHLTFEPDGRRGWVTDNDTRRLLAIDARGLRAVEQASTDGAPHHVAVTADGRWVVVADNTNGRLILYRATDGRRAGSIAVGAGPHGIWAVP
jgi:DNA-binding beta-propeller fold protein YncE